MAGELGKIVEFADNISKDAEMISMTPGNKDTLHLLKKIRANADAIETLHKKFF